MVILSRKAAEQNPASTAALRRVGISLSNQRRALRHPAGAHIQVGKMMKKSSAGEMKRIREEVMNGTFAREKSVVWGHSLGIRIAGVALAGLLVVAAPAAMASGADRRVETNREVDRVKVENLQRWVSAGHEEWCKDARLVAMDELRRVARDAADLEAVPMEEEATSEKIAVFAWTSFDGHATYRVTVERFAWLLPIAGEEESIVWVPTHVEVITHR